MTRRAPPCSVAIAAVTFVVALGAGRAQGNPAEILLWPDAQGAASPSVEERLAEALRPRDVTRSAAIRASAPVVDAERREARALAAAEAALADARAAYLRFDFARARAALAALLDGHLATMSDPGQSELLATALRLGAQVDLALRDTAMARGRLEVAVSLRPAAPAAHPDLARLEAEVAGQLARAGLRPFRVTSTPPGAAVWIDGRRAGTTPLRVDVRRGGHLLRLEREGHLAAARIVQVPAEVGSAHVPLEPDPNDDVLLRRIARAAVDTADGAARRALLARARAAHLVLYREEAGGVVVSVAAPDRPAVRVSGDPGDAGFRAQLRDALDGRAALADQPTPLLRRWWFWAAAGTVVAGAVAISAAAYQPPPQRALVRASPP